MNNRELINNQLNNSTNSLFVVKSSNNIQHQIPEQVEPEKEQGTLGSVNNFNVNVNVNSSPEISNPKQQVKNILNNVLNVQQPKTTEDLKKNYEQGLKQSGNFNYNTAIQQILPQSNFKLNFSNNYLLKTYGTSDNPTDFLNNYLNTENVLNKNLINIASDSTNLNSIPNEVNQTISYDSSDKILQQNINKQNILNKSEVKTSNNNFSNLINGLTIQSNLNAPEINSYTYSTANLKNENIKLNLAFEKLNNVIRHSTPQNSTVSSTFTNEFTIDQIQNQRNMYENKNFTLQTTNQNNNLEFMDNTIRKHESIMVNRTNMVQNQLLQLAKSNDKQQEDKELVDEMNDIIPMNKESMDMVPSNHTMPNKDFIHINETYDGASEEMIMKMNSPPIWRTVLG